jgi:hypothetical protein
MSRSLEFQKTRFGILKSARICPCSHGELRDRPGGSRGDIFRKGGDFLSAYHCGRWNRLILLTQRLLSWHDSSQTGRDVRTL